MSEPKAFGDKAHKKHKFMLNMLLCKFSAFDSRGNNDLCSTFVGAEK